MYELLVTHPMRRSACVALSLNLRRSFLFLSSRGRYWLLRFLFSSPWSLRCFERCVDTSVLQCFEHHSAILYFPILPRNARGQLCFFQLRARPERYRGSHVSFAAPACNIYRRAASGPPWLSSRACGTLLPALASVIPFASRGPKAAAGAIAQNSPRRTSSPGLSRPRRMGPRENS